MQVAIRTFFGGRPHGGILDRHCTEGRRKKARFAVLELLRRRTSCGYNPEYLKNNKPRTFQAMRTKTIAEMLIINSSNKKSGAIHLKKQRHDKGDLNAALQDDEIHLEADLCACVHVNFAADRRIA